MRWCFKCALPLPNVALDLCRARRFYFSALVRAPQWIVTRQSAFNTTNRG
jgi:hypothetical protein